MRVTVKLFAVLREKLGTTEMNLNVPEGSTVADVEKTIASTRELNALLSRAAFAVNQEYVPRCTVLHDGDELAIIPPVSGG